MSHPDPAEDWNCEHWSEQDDENGQSHEFCRAVARPCSCSGMKIECTTGMYRFRDRDIEEDR